MSQSSNKSNGTKSAARFTTTATINCAAYPADSVTAGDSAWKKRASPSVATQNTSADATGRGGVAGISTKHPVSSFDNNCINSSATANPNNSVVGGYRYGLKKVSGGGDEMSSRSNGSVNNYSNNSVNNCKSNSSANNYNGSGGNSLASGNGVAVTSCVPGTGVPPPPAPPLPPPNLRSFNGNANLTSTLNRSSKAPMASAPASYNSLPRGFVSNTNRAFKQHNNCPSSSIGMTNVASSSAASVKPSVNLKTVRRTESADVAGKGKVDTSDPQVRKLVYNMYRGLLDKKHDHSNSIIDNMPDLQVDRDEGVKDRLLSIMKQQEELKAGKITTMNGPAGPPPPPPPPPFIVPGATPPVMAEAAPSLSRAPSKGTAPQLPPQVAPPAALAGAMMKDKKPFTYTPGGLDLSEISPAPNGAPPVPEGPPMQSRSFRLLQNVVDGEASDPQGPVHIPLIKSQQPQSRQQGGGSSGAIPSRAFRALQQHTDAQQDVAGPGESDL